MSRTTTVHAPATSRIHLAPPTRRHGAERPVGWALLIDAGLGGKVVIDAGPNGRTALFTFAERLRRELVTACEAEHENGLHLSTAEPGCPMCEREAAEAPPLLPAEWAR